VKLVHLVGVITKKNCYDARSHERKKKKKVLHTHVGQCLLISFSWIFPQADVAQGLTYTQTRTPTHIGVIQFGSL